MGKFFESELVREDLNEINQLQQEIYSSTMNFPSMTRENQLEHVPRGDVLPCGFHRRFEVAPIAIAAHVRQHIRVRAPLERCDRRQGGIHAASQVGDARQS